MSEQSRWVSLSLAVLLVWSFALRVWLSTPNPTSSRFWDERYGIENIHALLVEGTIRPANGFHPGLSYLPQAAVLAGSEALHRLTGKPAFAVFKGEGMTPTGYLLCRFLQAVFGALSIYLTYRIGCQVFSPRAGLLGAFLLAVVPWHLRQSVIYKPDILLVAASLFAFDRSLAAAARPTWRRYLAAGSAIGLALASKFNAGPIAFPLMTAALAGDGWRDRRAWGRLVLAGAASIAVFLLLTPYIVLDWDLYRTDFSRTLRDYERKGAQQAGSHLGALWHGVQSLFTGSFHGPVIGAVALLGLALLVVHLSRDRREDSPRKRLGPAMILSYVLGYSLVYALSTHNPSRHNWLPLMPFTALAAAWLFVGLWEQLAARMPFLRRPAVVGSLLAVMVLLLIRPVSRYTYWNAVPTTHALARRYLEEKLQPLRGRTVIFERGGSQERLLRGRSGAFPLGIERLDELPPARIEQADAVLFQASRLEGEGSALYRKLAATGAATGEETVRFAPTPFLARGTPLIMVVHRWRQVGGPVALRIAPRGPRSGRLEARLPEDVRPGEMLSLEIVLPSRWRADSLRQVQVQGENLEWEAGGQENHRRRNVTRRFQVTDPKAPIEILLSRPLQGKQELKVRFLRWER